MADRVLSASTSLAAILAGKGGGPTSIAVVARKLLRAARAAQLITIAAAPATVTQGASGAAPTLKSDGTVNYLAVSAANANGQQLFWGDGRLGDVSGTWAPDVDNAGTGYIANHVSNRSTGAKRGHTWGAGKRFGFDGQAFEVVHYTGSGSNPVQLMVVAQDLLTGARQWCTVSGGAPSAYVGPAGADSTFRAHKVDFGSAAPRIVEVYVGGVGNFTGFPRSLVVGPNDTVWAAPQADETRIAIFGDSWVFGTNPATFRTTLAHTVGERFGANVIVSAVSGSGLFAAQAGFTWRQRVANGDLDEGRIGRMDLVLLPFGVSVNDSGQTDAAVQAELALLVQAIMAAQPSAIIMVGGTQYTAAGPAAASRFAAAQAGVAAGVAAANDNSGRVVYIDNSPAGDAHVRAVEEGQTECDAALLHQSQQAFPDPEPRPADEHLRRPPPWAKVSGDGAPLRAVLVPPQDRAQRAAQVLQRRLALRPTRIDQRLQLRPLRIAQHRSPPSHGGNVSLANTFRR